jgi:nitroimidazol reductase NimA-like FMN-containing flavoprotein (pyridoxamine 5'-phosphate oxidase superfamily)
MTTTSASLSLPPGYGKPTVILPWQEIRERLVRAERYWLATTRPDGRPHVVPLDGIWLDDLWYFGGSPKAVHQRNLNTNQQVAINLEDALSAVIVEGRAEFVTLPAEVADRLATASRAKYPYYGATPQGYAAGVWRMRPTVAFAWNRLDTDATRFTF